MDETRIRKYLLEIQHKLDLLNTSHKYQCVKTQDILARLSHIGAIVDSTTRKPRLGKKIPKIDSRTLKLAKYLGSLPAPPASSNWLSGISSWGVMLNDALGDCTIAACGHAVQVWSAALGRELTLPDWIILCYYEVWAGYVPGDANTDQGAYEIDVLNKWRRYGFGRRANKQGFDKLFAYADPDPGNKIHIKQAISLFGGVYIGLSLPVTAQDQSIWDVVGDGQSGDSAPGSWGGHAVFCPAYDEKYITCITWGGLKRMTWEFWNAYCDESHALLSSDFIDAKGISASGFDLATLKADLITVSQ